jgi:hypothetical protein
MLQFTPSAGEFRNASITFMNRQAVIKNELRKNVCPFGTIEEIRFFGFLRVPD